MTPFFTIALEGLRFRAPHGVYDGEALTGNSFEVDLRLEVDGSVPVESIGQTVNYVEAYALLRELFAQRQDLLETLCQQVAGVLEARFPQMRRVDISIRKLTPAIDYFQGAVRVSLSKAYNT